MFRRVLSFLICAIAISGCATVPPPRAMPFPSLAAHRLILGSISYLPTSAVTQAVNGRVHWDPQSQMWTLTAGPHELRAAAEMPVVLIDGAPESLPAAPVLSEKGELLLPEVLWSKWLGYWGMGVPPRLAPVPSLHLKTIVLDAGHGGHDPGAIGRTGLREKSVTLDIAVRLKDLLENDGFHVLMTRDSDRFVSLSRRAEFANEEEGDLFVSIHANASRRRSISGYEVYTLSEATDDYARALEAAENTSLPEEVGQSVPLETGTIVWDLLYTEHRARSLELAAAVCGGLKNTKLHSQNRGVKSARFAVLKGSRMPAVLVEVGFITHPQEEARLKTTGYRQAIAEGIESGILNFRSEIDRRI